MIKPLIITIAILTSSACFAQDTHSGAVAGSQSTSSAGSTSGSAANSANANYVNFPVQPSNTEQRVIYAGEVVQKSAPPIMITGPASGPCTGNSGGVGASWLGAGFGINSASVDRGCHWRENARTMAMILPLLSAENKTKFEEMIVDSMTKANNYDPSLLGSNSSN